MRKLFLFLTVICTLVSCSTFISKETEQKLTLQYEVPVFVMIKDLDIKGKIVLKKGETVKLLLNIKSSQMSDSTIKVYAYKYVNEESLLKSERFLMIYLFDTSFTVTDQSTVEKDSLDGPVFDEKKLDNEIRLYVTEKK